MQPGIQDMTALPSWSHYPLKIKNQQTPSRSKCKFWAPRLVSKLNPFFRHGRLAKFSPLKRRSALLSTINAWSTNFNVICATQIMSGTPPDIYTSALTNPNTRQSGGIFSNTAYWRLIWLTSNFLSWRNIDLSLIDSIRAKLLSLSLYIFTFLFVSLRNSCTFIFVLILLIFDLMMTLSERRDVVAFLNF